MCLVRCRQRRTCFSECHCVNVNPRTAVNLRPGAAQMLVHNARAAAARMAAISMAVSALSVPSKTAFVPPPLLLGGPSPGTTSWIVCAGHRRAQLRSASLGRPVRLLSASAADEGRRSMQPLYGWLRGLWFLRCRGRSSLWLKRCHWWPQLPCDVPDVLWRVRPASCSYC